VLFRSNFTMCVRTEGRRNHMEFKFEDEDSYGDSEFKLGSAIYHDNFRAPAGECSLSHCLSKCYGSGIGKCFPMVLVFIYVVYLII
jgi:hypothetical protein